MRLKTSLLRKHKGCEVTDQSINTFKEMLLHPPLFQKKKRKMMVRVQNTSIVDVEQRASHTGSEILIQTSLPSITGNILHCKREPETRRRSCDPHAEFTLKRRAAQLVHTQTHTHTEILAFLRDGSSCQVQTPQSDQHGTAAQHPAARQRVLQGGRYPAWLQQAAHVTRGKAAGGAPSRAPPPPPTSPPSNGGWSAIIGCLNFTDWLQS